jgi:hypothetical protein
MWTETTRQYRREDLRFASDTIRFALLEIGALVRTSVPAFQSTSRYAPLSPGWLNFDTAHP